MIRSGPSFVSNNWLGDDVEVEIGSSQMHWRCVFVISVLCSRKVAEIIIDNTGEVDYSLVETDP